MSQFPRRFYFVWLALDAPNGPRLASSGSWVSTLIERRSFAIDSHDGLRRAQLGWRSPLGFGPDKTPFKTTQNHVPPTPSRDA
jgi:hypothetical protein